MTWETHSRNRKNKGDVSHRNFVHWLFELSLYLFQLVNNSVWKINYMHKHQQYLNDNFGINLAYQCTACVSVYALMFSDKWRSYQAGHDLKSIIIIFRLPSKESPSSASSQVRTLQLDERVLKSQRNVSQQIGFQVEKTSSQQPASDVRHKKDFFHMSLSNKVIHF